MAKGRTGTTTTKGRTVEIGASKSLRKRSGHSQTGLNRLIPRGSLLRDLMTHQALRGGETGRKDLGGKARGGLQREKKGLGEKEKGAGKVVKTKSMGSEKSRGVCVVDFGLMELAIMVKVASLHMFTMGIQKIKSRGLTSRRSLRVTRRCSLKLWLVKTRR